MPDKYTHTLMISVYMKNKSTKFPSQPNTARHDLMNLMWNEAEKQFVNYTTSCASVEIFWLIIIEYSICYLWLNRFQWNYLIVLVLVTIWICEWNKNIIKTEWRHMFNARWSMYCLQCRMYNPQLVCFLCLFLNWFVMVFNLVFLYR